MDQIKLKLVYQEFFIKPVLTYRDFLGNKPILSIKLRILSTYGAKVLRDLGVDRIWTGSKNS